MPSSLSLLLLLCAMAATSQAGLVVSKLRANGASTHRYIGTPDAYVKVSCGTFYLGKTSTRHNNVNPSWWVDFHYSRAQEGDVLKLEVYDKDFLVDDLLGSCQRPIQVGVWNDVQCFLKRGGILYYSYTFTK